MVINVVIKEPVYKLVLLCRMDGMLDGSHCSYSTDN